VIALVQIAILLIANAGRIGDSIVAREAVIDRREPVFSAPSAGVAKSGALSRGASIRDTGQRYKSHSGQYNGARTRGKRKAARATLRDGTAQCSGIAMRAPMS